MIQPDGQNGDRFMTLPQVQTYLGIRSRKTILKYISEQRLSAYKIGGTRWRFDRSDVENFLANHRTQNIPTLRNTARRSR